MHLLLSLVLLVQAGSDPLLTRLAGQWTGTGTVLNQTSKISLTWSWELGGQFLRPLDARRDGDALVSKWGTPDTEEGETTYRLTSDSRMEIVDRVKSKDGTWREFGRSVVTR